MKNYLLGILVFLVSILGFTAPATADTPIGQCVGTWSIVVGGLNDQDSRSVANANQRVGYFTYDTRAGISELNRLTWDHRNLCPGDRIKIVGYSGGAAVAHRWATENGQHFRGVASVVLIADPKRPAGPGGPGFAATDFPINLVNNGLAGADGDYGGLPTLQLCNSSDRICNSQASWDGYLYRGAHANYPLDVNAYAWGMNGQWFFFDR